MSDGDPERRQRKKTTRGRRLRVPVDEVPRQTTSLDVAAALDGSAESMLDDGDLEEIGSTPPSAPPPEAFTQPPARSTPPADPRPAPTAAIAPPAPSEREPNSVLVQRSMVISGAPQAPVAAAALPALRMPTFEHYEVDELPPLDVETTTPGVTEAAMEGRTTHPDPDRYASIADEPHDEPTESTVVSGSTFPEEASTEITIEEAPDGDAFDGLEAFDSDDDDALLNEPTRIARPRSEPAPAETSAATDAPAPQSRPPPALSRPASQPPAQIPRPRSEPPAPLARPRSEPPAPLVARSEPPAPLVARSEPPAPLVARSELPASSRSESVSELPAELDTPRSDPPASEPSAATSAALAAMFDDIGLPAEAPVGESAAAVPSRDSTSHDSTSHDATSRDSTPPEELATEELAADEIAPEEAPVRPAPPPAPPASGVRPPPAPPGVSRATPPTALPIATQPAVPIAAPNEQPVAVAPPSAPSASAAHSASEPEAPKRKKRAKVWWEEFFNDDYLRTVRPPKQEQVVRQCNFLEYSLGLQKGATILDVGCGLGLQAVELASRGYLVVGLDLSLPMLSRAADEAQDREIKMNFLHGDMREMTFEGAFDAVLCLGTTFGYFDDDTNRQVLERMKRALKPQGLLLLDLVNRDFVVQGQPNLVWFEGDGCICMEETQFNYITSRLHVKRTVILEDGRQRENEYAIRLYPLHEVGQVMHQMGFRVAEVSGMEATPGVYFGATSPRLIILAERRVERGSGVMQAVSPGHTPPPSPVSEPARPMPPSEGGSDDGGSSQT